MKKTNTNKQIRIVDIYDYKELMAILPFNSENIYHIKIGRYGYLHDVGTEIILTPINGEKPTGWKSLKSDFNKEVKRCHDIWKLNIEYGYHGCH